MLSCVGLLAALATVDEPYALVLLLPLIAMLMILGRDRELRIAQSVELSSAYRGSRCCSTASSRPTTDSRASTAAGSSTSRCASATSWD
jgi:hypothetical protein